MKFHQATLPVSDIGRSRKFYLDLGLQLIVDSDHYCRFADPDHTGTLSIEQSDGSGDGPIGTGAILYFEYESPNALDQAVRDLTAKGLVISAPQDQRWLWREAKLQDPDGHPIKLFYAGENRLNPPWRVTEPQ